MDWIVHAIKNISRKQFYLYSILIVCCVSTVVFVSNNYAFYDRPIAKVVQTKLESATEETDSYQNKDKLFTQHITAELKNGPEKGELIYLTNTYSLSKAYDQAYEAGDELFVTIDKKGEKDQALTGGIRDVKRDKYMAAAFWLFMFVLFGVGKKQGLFAVISLAVNVILLTWAIEIYVQTDTNLLLLSGILAVLFTVLSLLFVNGFNGKTYAAIVATLVGTIASLAITLIVMRLTLENGLRYEEMQFLTRPYKLVFIAGLFIGSLGAVMDVAITMSSSIFELLEKDNNISIKALKTSGMDIGKDIMGTMTSILFFAYISGSIPMLILYLNNASPLGFTLSINLSLELTRALAGGIGIVLTIPIGLYTSIFFAKRKRAKS